VPSRLLSGALGCITLGFCLIDFAKYEHHRVNELGVLIRQGPRPRKVGPLHLVTQVEQKDQGVKLALDLLAGSILPDLCLQD
jgi:hypothetical protein